MRATWAAGLAMLAASGAAGVAAATDDCLSGGFYQVCLLDDHSFYTPTWNGYTTGTTNTVVSASGSGAAASLRQHETTTYACTFPCSTQEDEGTTASVAGSGFHVEAGQRASSFCWGQFEWACYGTYSRQTAATVEVAGHRAAAGQYETGFVGGSGTCAQRASLDGFTVPLGPCQAGPVGIVVPQLTDACWPTPAGPVCGTLPDWPDGTGLPFL